MAFPVIPIISEVVALGRSWLEGKQKKQEARDERTAELIKQQGSWEEIMAQGSTTSWKDEWLTALFSIPLILAFIPPATPYVLQGFVVLENMPEWYRMALGVVVAASFGIRSATQLFAMKKGG